MLELPAAAPPAPAPELPPPTLMPAPLAPPALEVPALSELQPTKPTSSAAPKSAAVWRAQLEPRRRKPTRGLMSLGSYHSHPRVATSW